MNLASSTIKVGPHPDRLEGIYRNRPAYVAAWAGCVALVPLVVLTVVRSPSPAMLGAGALVVLAALAAAFAVGRRGVRPRFEVRADGVRVVNPGQTRTLAWAEIAAFDCRQNLVVRTTDQEDLVVTALPTRTWGGPVATLAEHLNARHAEARSSATATTHNGATLRHG